MKCLNCKYYDPFDKTASFGECHRYPPPLLDDAAERYYALFPRVDGDDWCGEYSSGRDKLKRKRKDLP